MARYEVLLRRSALRKDLARLHRKDVQRIMATIGALADNPRPRGSQKLSGREEYRIRQGDYRIVYTIQDQEKTVWIVKVGHRRDVYR